MKPSPNSDRQSCASLGELFPKNGTAFATESPTTFVSSRPTIFGSSRRPGIARFQLLDEHYGSDLARLEGVREAGSLLGALSPQICPLCGASPESQKHEADCDGNIEVVVSAADAESRKIKLLRSELHETVDQL